MGSFITFPELFGAGKYQSLDSGPCIYNDMYCYNNQNVIVINISMTRKAINDNLLFLK